MNWERLEFAQYEILGFFQYEMHPLYIPYCHIGRFFREMLDYQRVSNQAEYDPTYGCGCICAPVSEWNDAGLQPMDKPWISSWCYFPAKWKAKKTPKVSSKSIECRLQRILLIYWRRMWRRHLVSRSLLIWVAKITKNDASFYNAIRWLQ